MSSDYVKICCKPITEHLSLSLSVNIGNKYNIFFCNVHVKLLSLLFQTQLKTLINIFHHCSIYLFVFFETHSDRVTLVPLSAIGFDGLIVFDEVTGFRELAVCGGAVVRHFLVIWWWLV